MTIFNKVYWISYEKKNIKKVNLAEKSIGRKTIKNRLLYGKKSVLLRSFSFLQKNTVFTVKKAHKHPHQKEKEIVFSFSRYSNFFFLIKCTSFFFFFSFYFFYFFFFSLSLSRIWDYTVINMFKKHVFSFSFSYRLKNIIFLLKRK